MAEQDTEVQAKPKKKLPPYWVQLGAKVGGNPVDYDGLMASPKGMTNFIAQAAVAGYALFGSIYAFGDGSALNPAITWANELASGIYRVGAGHFAYAVASASVTEWKAAEFRVSYLTAGQIVFPTAGGKLTGSGNLFWDNTNLFQTITGGGGSKQLRLAYDGTHYLDLTVNTSAAWAGTTVSLIPSGIQNNAFAMVRLYGSDFCFSYTGSDVNGEGVPNVTISGPPNTGTYTAASGPGFNLNNELSAVDNRLWSMYLNDKTLTFQVINDANNIVTNWLTVLRAGNAISAITFPSTVGKLECSSWFNLGTTTDATAQGDFSTGKTGVARLSYVQATPTLSFVNASNATRWQLTATTMDFANAHAIQWKDSGGTLRTALQLFSDNNIYFDNRAAGSFFVRGGPSAGNTNNFLVILNTGAVGLGSTTTPRRTLDILNASAAQLRLTQADNSVFVDCFLNSSGNLLFSPTGTKVGIQAGANGQQIDFEELTELTTVAAAATTDTAIQIPADAVVLAVSVRVKTVIPTAATFTVTGATSGTQFDVAGGVSTAANTTDVGTRNCTFKNGAAQAVRITPNLAPGAATGQVRVTIHFYRITPATS